MVVNGRCNLGGTALWADRNAREVLLGPVRVPAELQALVRGRRRYHGVGRTLVGGDVGVVLGVVETKCQVALGRKRGLRPDDRWMVALKSIQVGVVVGNEDAAVTSFCMCPED
jgi:hypothetical protein